MVLEHPLWSPSRSPGDGERDHSSLFVPCLIEQVQMAIEARFVSDILRGNDTTEIRVTLVRYIDDEMPPDDE